MIDIKSALLGVIVYSAIITVWLAYKEATSMYSSTIMDVIVAGPICWVLNLASGILGLLMSLIAAITPQSIKRKLIAERMRPKQYTKAQVKKIVARVVRRNKKLWRKNKRMKTCYMSLSCRHESARYNIYGWSMMTPMIGNFKLRLINKRLNGRFSNLFYNDATKAVAIEELQTYFRRPQLEELVTCGIAWNEHEADEIISKHNVVAIDFD